MLGLSDRFFENKALLFSAAVVAFIVAALLILLVFRLAFGRRLRMGGAGRARQPRLGVVDAFDLDRQRQLVIIRRDNVEHLIMIGGPNDLVIEAEIVRAEARETTRREITAVVPWPPGAAPAAQPQTPATAAPVPPAIEPRPAPVAPAPPVVLPEKVAPAPAVEEETVVIPAPPLAQPSPASPRPALFPSLRKVPPLPPRPSAPAADSTPAPNENTPKLNGPAPLASPPQSPSPIAAPPLSPGRVPGPPPGFLRPPTRVTPSIGSTPPAPPLSAVPRPSAPQPIAPVAPPPPKPSEPTPAPTVPADMLDSLEEEMAKLLGRNPKDGA